MDKEKMLKKVCRKELVGVWDTAISIGRGLERPKDREWSEKLNRRFRRSLLWTLTRKLKRAGVLPLAERR